MLLRILQAMILGIVQGATEFIPVSSSAHLIIVPWLFGWTDAALTSLSFDIALHVGTLPGGLVGMLAESKIDKLFHTPGTPIRLSAIILMAAIIAVLGLALFLAEKLARHTRQMNDLSLKDTAIIGLAQALAVFPGVSRSGSTITAGLALGLKRDVAARFSFLLSAPIIAGAGVKSLLEVLGSLHSGAITKGDLILFPVGVIAAAVSGYLCIGFLLRYLQRKSINIFVYYRWALATLLIVVALIRG